MLLVYMYASLALGCIVIFLAAYHVGKDIRDDAIALVSYGITHTLDTLDVAALSRTKITQVSENK